MKVWAYPQRVPHWCKLHVVLTRLGWTSGAADDHDLRTLFSNRTLDRGGVILDREGRREGKTTTVRERTINGRCTDVTKTRTDAVFTEAFGYSSLVNPRRHPCVEKTDVQATKMMREVEAGTFSWPVLA